MTTRRLSILVIGFVFLFAARTGAQTTAQTIKICQGLSIPDGYNIVGETTSPDCPQGAYLLKRESSARASGAAGNQTSRTSGDTPAARPRRVADSTAAQRTNASTRPTLVINNPYPGTPKQRRGAVVLIGASKPRANAPAPAASEPPVQTDEDAAAAAADLPGAATAFPEMPEEVGEDDVVRVETTLVTVPVSVMDRNGKFIPNLKREDFQLFENGVEQAVTHFDTSEKPFTVALMLDTSGSTRFRLWDIKDAAIEFASQLRPQDRVLVVTFSDDVMLLTEATNDRKVISAVITLNSRAGNSTRLYDALQLVIKERLDKIQGRKAIVLFTDGVDTSSYIAGYESVMREAEELDALIYPIQYDTFNDMQVQTGGQIITTSTIGQSYPSGSNVSFGTINQPNATLPPAPGASREEYDIANRFLHQLADKTGAQLYRADDPQQLKRAFALIAEELRRQYSLGYYPKTDTPAGGEQREIKVRVRRPNLVVRSRNSYVSSAASPATK